MSAFDLAVTFPAPGSIVVRSRALFGDVDGPLCRRFIERVFQAREIRELAITARGTARAELRYCPRAAALPDVVSRVARALGQGMHDGPRPEAGRPLVNGHAGRKPAQAAPVIPPAHAARDARGVVRYYRFDTLVTGCRVRSARPGCLHLRNPALQGSPALGRAVERALGRQSGVASVRANAWLGTVEIVHDPAHLSTTELIAAVDAVLAGSSPAPSRERAGPPMGLCTAIVPVAAAAQLAVPPLVPVAAAACVYAALPTLGRAYRALSQERRLGADALEAIVVLGCLGTMSLLPAALICWCQGFGQMLAERTHDRSRRLILGGFARRPERAWLHRNGVDVEVSLSQVRPGDVVGVDTGAVVPVDGYIIDGFCWVDQEPLTGESAPVKRGVGEKVFAATILVAGRVYVSAERCGDATATAAIGRMFEQTAIPSMGEPPCADRRADRAALPALVLGGVGLATLGPLSGLAILKSNAGAGMRSAGTYAALGAAALCAQRGIVVNNARGLERMSAVDAVVLDASAIVDGSALTVDRVAALPGFTPDRVLQLAAAAGQRFHEPAARAIRERAQESSDALPRADDIQCRIGHGIHARVEGHDVRVGDRPFVVGGVPGLPCDGIEAIDTTGREGRTVVLVSVDDRLAGTIALEAALRPELRAAVAGLRQRGVTRIAIAAEDPAFAQRAADALGPEREFVRFVRRSQEGNAARANGVICFVSSGNASAITADVRVGLGPDAAGARDFHIYESNLTRLCELRDIARDLHQNVERSWALALAPNAACVAGVFALGLGIMASVIASNVSALAALTNSVLPLRRAARAEAERQHRQELTQRVSLERDSL